MTEVGAVGRACRRVAGDHHALLAADRSATCLSTSASSVFISFTVFLLARASALSTCSSMRTRATTMTPGLALVERVGEVLDVAAGHALAEMLDQTAADAADDGRADDGRREDDADDPADDDPVPTPCWVGFSALRRMSDLAVAHPCRRPPRRRCRLSPRRELRGARRSRPERPRSCHSSRRTRRCRPLAHADSFSPGANGLRICGGHWINLCRPSISRGRSATSPDRDEIACVRGKTSGMSAHQAGESADRHVGACDERDGGEELACVAREPVVGVPKASPGCLGPELQQRNRYEHQ